jgi:hypothetical protein
MDKCAFCGLNEPVPKSHVMPERMYRGLYDEKHRLVMVGGDLSLIGKDRQKGHREPILCKECESIFNANFEKPSWRVIDEIKKGDSDLIFIPECLGLLVISVIWRCSVSASSEWKISIGPHADIMRECLKNRTVDGRYYMWMMRGIGSGEVGDDKLISCPRILRVKGHDMCHFYADGIQFILKISSHDIRVSVPSRLVFNEYNKVDCMRVDALPSLFMLFGQRLRR